jgi:uncharacterized secreted protein with C-terminal beta-propeller domain
VIFMKMEFNLLLTVIVVGIVAATLLYYPQIEPDGGTTPPMTFSEMPRFESYEAMEKAFEESRNMGRGGIFETIVRGISTTVPMAADASKADGESGTDYSTTNIQVEGVDEADIVKTDGTYIYNFSRGKLAITKAYPVEGSEIVYNKELPEVQPQEMFVRGDKLVLFGYKVRKYDQEQGISAEEIMMPRHWGYSQNAVVQLYDISDRASPSLEKEVEFEGSYVTSRLIGKEAYFVVDSWTYYRQCEGSDRCLGIIPLMVEDGVEKDVAEATEIGYIPPMPAESFVTIASLDLDNGKIEKETIAGNAQNVYASQQYIYLAATAWIPNEGVFPDGTPIVDPIEDVVLPSIEETIVTKFGMDKGKVGYVGQGRVPGHVLNQFSMDEFQGNFRIATSIGWNGSNNLYVLDEEMNTIGRLEDLAPGESIYSARFMGEKAYIVTFKKVDPLFVIDVSNPREPTVLGKLKIPGYSDYLHPIDETHLIGIGKDTIESAKGDFAWYQGLKMAVFDVSDVENPIEMHKLIVGDRGTESYALHDHKAFLYDREKELLVLPIILAEIPESQKKPIEEGQPWPAYGELTFQGAFVYRLTLEDGFEERGRITHVSEEDELKRGYYYGDNYSVKRALYIGNVLYTLSDKMLKANDLGSLEELKEFAFG